MNRTLATLALAALLALGCSQEEGEVCQVYGTANQGDCGDGLTCCGATRSCAVGGATRGICVVSGTCEGMPTPFCGDAGMIDAGPPVDAGPVPDAGPDAGEEVDAGTTDDAGSDAGAAEDAGVDAGPDAGPDAGSDAGSDAGPDAGPDAG